MPKSSSPFTLRAALRRQAVLIVALIAMVGCIVAGVLQGAQTAGIALSALLFALAAIRIVASASAVGALAVRRKRTDAAVLLVLAIGLAVLSGSPNL